MVRVDSTWRMNANPIFPVALDYAERQGLHLDFCLLRTMLGDIRGIAADLGTVQVSTVTNNEWHHFFGISLLYVGSIK